MEQFILLLIVIIIVIFIVFAWHRKRKKQGLDFDPHKIKGFDRNKIRWIGIKYDDEGYNRFGYNRQGFNRQGFNRQGYNAGGKDQKGRYDRFFDVESFKNGPVSTDGFLNPRVYPVSISIHAQLRMQERIEFRRGASLYKIALDAYRYGKSARQIKKSSAAMVREIEEKSNNGIVLIYHDYIYIFSKENELITMYKNDRIPL